MPSSLSDSHATSRRIPIWSLGVLGLSLVALPGCDNSSNAKKESDTPKYQVAESEDSATSTGDSKVAPGEGKPVPPPPSGIAANPTPSGVGQVPTFEAGGTQPDNRSFMVIKPTDATDAKGLIQFIEETDVAFRELILSFQGQQVTEAILRDRGAAISRMKLKAAEKLAEAGTETIEKEASILAKIEALSQMTGFQDANAARQLEAYAKEVEKIESPKVAHQATVVLFSFRLQDFKAGQLESAQPLLEMMDTLLSDKTLLGVPDMRMLQQTLAVLERSGDQAAFDQAKKKVVDAFSDHPSPNLMMEAWQMNVSGSISLSNLQKAIESIMKGEDNPASTTLLKEAIDTFIAEFPQAATMMTIASQAIQVEYSGKVEHAKVMVDAVAAKLSDIKQPEFQSEVKKIVDEFQLRYGLIGKPLNLIGLVDSEGNAFDLAAYKGKVVLIDFWATWCQPCLGEFPNLTTVYSDLKDKGFEIVGINLDERAEDLAAFQAKNRLPWKVVRSSDPNAVGFSTKAAEQVGVSAIPLMILVDAEGNVAAIHIRGEKVQTKVMELLSSKAAGGA